MSDYLFLSESEFRKFIYFYQTQIGIKTATHSLLSVEKSAEPTDIPSQYNPTNKITTPLLILLDYTETYDNYCLKN